MNSKYGNFENVFNPLPSINFDGHDPKAMFRHHNFINKNELLYNNLNNILLNEEIREYSVMIDSKDRNYQVYPDPFNYEVKFSPLPKIIEKVNGKKVIYEEANPIINDTFINVRYIKLESIILPFFYKIRTECKTNEDDEIVKNYKIDTRKALTENLYTVLSIGKYTDTNYRSTNDVLGDSFATIYYSNRISDTHFLGQTFNGTKIFPQDQLEKIVSFKICFMDPYGKPIKCSHLDKKIKSNLECTCEDSDGDDETDCFKHNLFHPLNPIFQHHLHFKIGVLEPRLGKRNY